MQDAYQRIGNLSNVIQDSGTSCWTEMILIWKHLRQLSMLIALHNAINKGWIDAKAYSPMCLLAWNAVTTKVNDKGQVEGTCVGTGMAFEPMFYYYRPVNVFAAHGYGRVLLAGAEVIHLLKTHL